MRTVHRSLLAHLSRRFIGELIVYVGIRRLSVVCLYDVCLSVVCQHFSNNFSSEAVWPIHIASIGGGRGANKCAFCSSRIRTLLLRKLRFLKSYNGKTRN